MKKAILAIAAAATIVGGILSAPTTADAYCRGCGVGAGVIGGLAAGAIIGGIASQSGNYDRGSEYYAPGPAYDGPSCYITRQRVCDGYGCRLERVRVCD